MVYQGKSGGNPDGLPSILTQIKRKFTFQNHGSDLYYHPMFKVFEDVHKDTPNVIFTVIS